MDFTSVSQKPAFSSIPYIIYLTLLIFLSYFLYQLEPSQSGFGTHRQLGFPACGFLTVTGYPCPSCGVTTAFAYGIQGNWLDALKAQPFGLVLFLALYVIGIIAAIAIVKRIPLTKLIDSRSFEILQGALLILFFIGWIYKICIMHGLV